MFLKFLTNIFSSEEKKIFPFQTESTLDLSEDMPPTPRTPSPQRQKTLEPLAQNVVLLNTSPEIIEFKEILQEDSNEYNIINKLYHSRLSSIMSSAIKITSPNIQLEKHELATFIILAKYRSQSLQYIDFDTHESDQDDEVSSDEEYSPEFEADITGEISIPPQ